jgi:cell division protein FtsB
VKRFFPGDRFPRAENGLRALANRAPQAEAFAASWIEYIRPFGTTIHESRRRIATVAVAVLAGWMLVHVMFGPNGMIVYKEKRAEYQSLRKQVVQVQQDNDRYTQKIQSMKTDQTAIEKEAREQLGYVKSGEYVYVAPATAKPAVPANHTAKK